MAAKSDSYTSLSVNVPAPLVARIDHHVKAHRPFLKRHGVHLAAVVLGLGLLEQHPEKLAEALEEAERVRSTP